MTLPQANATSLSSRFKPVLITVALLMSALTQSSANTQQLICTPTTLSFNNVRVGQQSTLPATLTNTGSTSVTVSSFRANVAGFSLSKLAVPYTLAAGQSVGFNIIYAPTSVGYVQGKVGFITTAGKHALLAVNGTGVAQWALIANPSSLAFGNVQVGSSSTLTVALTNSGSSSLTISQDNVTGTGFSFSGLNLPLTLAGGQSLTFSVTFTPPAVGTDSGSVKVSRPSIGSLSIPLTGSGTAAGQLAISPATANFGNVTVGNSTSQTGALSATGARVTVSSVNDTNSEFTLSGISLPITIAAGQSVSYTVTFAPQSSGTATASLSFLSNAGNSPSVESLTGTGIQQQSYSVSLSWDPSTSQVAGYNVYRASNSGGPYSKINPSLDSSTIYADGSVASGQTYYYVTTAVNSSGVESAYSNQVQAVIP
jgi:Abnormal spindle-like microcephaly-assoc'd, ASPM-SPD-2-Hydin/Cep192 domain 4